jgi:hypothetical protein
MLVFGCAAWYLVLLVSFAGWGALLARYVAKEEGVDLGLRLGWGMATVLTLGGVLLATRSARAPVLVVVTLVGCAASVRDAYRRRGLVGAHLRAGFRSARRNPASLLMAAAILGIVGYRFVASPFLTSESFRNDDDAVAYMFFPKEIVETGTTIQPFSHHHTHSLNGQSFLQALALPFLRVEHAYGLDGGLALVVALALVAGISNRRWLDRSVFALLPELALVLTPTVRINLASQVTGLVAFLTLYRTLSRPAATEDTGRNALVVACCALFVFVLRPMFVPALVIVLFAAYAVPPLQRGSWKDRRAKLFHGLMVAAFLLLALLPWFYMEYRSDGTPLFPLIYGGTAHLPTKAHVRSHDLEMVRVALEPFPGAIAVALAAVWMRVAGARRERVGMIVGAFATPVVLVLTVQGCIPEDFYRYLLPTFGAMSLAIGAEAMGMLPSPNEEGPRFGRLQPAILVACAAVAYVYATRDAAKKDFESCKAELSAAKSNAAGYESREQLYARMQGAMAAGEGVMVETLDGYLFDLRRNHVYTPDRPGMAAPAPGFPKTSDDDAVRYLRSNGVRYLVGVVDGAPRPDPFNIGLWSARVGTSRPNDPGQWVQADMAPVMVPVMKLLDRLERTRKRVFNEDGFVVVDLTADG